MPPHHFQMQVRALLVFIQIQILFLLHLIRFRPQQQAAPAPPPQPPPAIPKTINSSIIKETTLKSPKNNAFSNPKDFINNQKNITILF